MCSDCEAYRLKNHGLTRSNCNQKSDNSSIDQCNLTQISLILTLCRRILDSISWILRYLSKPQEATTEAVG